MCGGAVEQRRRQGMATSRVLEALCFQRRARTTLSPLMSEPLLIGTAPPICVIGGSLAAAASRASFRVLFQFSFMALLSALLRVSCVKSMVSHPSAPSHRPAAGLVGEVLVEAAREAVRREAAQHRVEAAAPAGVVAPHLPSRANTYVQCAIYTPFYTPYTRFVLKQLSRDPHFCSYTLWEFTMYNALMETRWKTL